MQILIVDDSPPVLKLLEATLNRIGYSDVHALASGTEALEYLGFESDRAFEAVDLVLLDIVMPGVDGIEVCRRIKAETFYEDTPVIMVTIRDEQEVLKEAFDKGASDYIVKPVKELELIARVGAALRLRQETLKRKEREAQLEALSRKLEEQNVALVQKVNTDEITNIGNRHFFMHDLEKEWRRAIREAVPFTIMLIDIDFFREFEHINGQRKAQECLKLVANILRIALRRAGDQVARFEGGRFAISLPKTDDHGAQAVANAICANIEALRIKNPGSQCSAYITASIGTASLIPSLNSNKETLFQHAEEALAKAREYGHNQAQEYVV